MGNRAVVVFRDEDKQTHGVYLHWNGGPESVLAFLRVMQARGWTRMDYASARFAAVAIELSDHAGTSDGLSVGIVDRPVAWAAGADNGLYEVFAGDQPGKMFDVIHRGKKISVDGLGVEDRSRYEQIVAELARLRLGRRKYWDAQKGGGK